MWAETKPTRRRKSYELGNAARSGRDPRAGPAQDCGGCAPCQAGTPRPPWRDQPHLGGCDMVMMRTRPPKSQIEFPCLTDPDLFFAESPADIARAKELCRGCPAIEACLAGALARAEPW